MSKQIGELNGPWALLLRFLLVLFPILIPAVLAWGVWVTQRVSDLERGNAVMEKVVEQISINTLTIGRHEKELTTMQTLVTAIPSDQATIHEANRLRTLNETNTLVNQKFDELKTQLTLLQKDVMRVQIMLEQRASRIE